MKRLTAFYRFLSFYALIFLIPFAFSIVAYLQFTKVIENQEIEANIKLIEKTRDELDSQILEAEQIVDVLSRDPLVYKLGYQQSATSEDSLYYQWELSIRLDELLRTNNFVDSLYVYFDPIGRVVSSSGAVDKNLFYDKRMRYGDLTLAQWESLFLQTRYDKTFLPSTQVEIGSRRLMMITYLHSVLVDQASGTHSVVWLFIDSRQVQRVVRRPALSVPFVLERDLHLGAIGDDLAVIADVQIEIGNLGNAEILERLGCDLDCRGGGLLPGIRARSH